MTRVWLVGQAPSRTSDPARPFDGPTGRRLADLLGLPARALGHVFELANVLGAWPGAARDKGDRFPAREARAAAEELLARVPPGARVVAVGSGVAAAIGLDTSPLAWTACRGREAALLPHPSGMNLWWNERANREAAGAFLRAAALASIRAARTVDLGGTKGTRRS